MSKNLKTFPKLQTERIFPSEGFKSASRSMAAGSYMYASIVLPKDVVNIIILGVAGLGVAADGISPIPIGEAFFAAMYGLTKLKDKHLPNKHTKDYRKKVLQEAIKNLRTPQGPY